MKRSKFSETQVVAILKEGEAGRAVAEICREYGSATRRIISGSRSMEGWKHRT